MKNTTTLINTVMRHLVLNEGDRDEAIRAGERALDQVRALEKRIEELTASLVQCKGWAYRAAEIDTSGSMQEAAMQHAKDADAILAQPVQTKPRTNFQAMTDMVERDMDITLCPDLVNAQQTKKGGLVTVGVPPTAIDKVMHITEPYFVGLLIVNTGQLKKLTGAE